MVFLCILTHDEMCGKTPLRMFSALFLQSANENRRQGGQTARKNDVPLRSNQSLTACGHMIN